MWCLYIHQQHVCIKRKYKSRRQILKYWITSIFHNLVFWQLFACFPQNYGLYVCPWRLVHTDKEEIKELSSCGLHFFITIATWPIIYINSSWTYFHKENSFMIALGTTYPPPRLNFIEPYANLEWQWQFEEVISLLNHYEKLMLKCLLNSISLGIVWAGRNFDPW